MTNNNLADDLRKAMDKVREKMVFDALFGESPKYAPFVQTGQRKPDYGSRPWGFVFRPRNFVEIIESEYATERVTKCRPRTPDSFWRRLWLALQAPRPLSYWQHTLIEFYESDEPAIFWLQGKIICHPSLASKLRDTGG